MSVPRLIDDELFDLAQQERARRDPVKNPGRASSSPLLLSGLARCSRCGQTLQLVSATSRTGARHRYYQCRQAVRSGVETCRGRRIREDVLDRAVLNHAAEHLFSADRCREILRQYVQDEGVLRQRVAEERRLLERERAEVDRRLAQLLEHLETQPELGELVVDRLRDLKERRQAVLQKLSAVAPAPPVPPHLYRDETIARFQHRLRRAFLGDDRGIARAYLRRLIDSIVLGDDEVIIEARGEAALQVMAGRGSDQPAELTTETGEARVLADVLSWRARRDSNP